MSPSTKSETRRHARRSHAMDRHGNKPARAAHRPDRKARRHVLVIEALAALGWRVTEIRPSSEHGAAMWVVAIERVDLVASMSVAALEPDAALEELARYAAADAEER